MKTKENQEIRKAALKLYTPPFRYECGYIWDSKGRMTADQGAMDSIMRVRGWGHIKYLKEFKPEDLQDEIGLICAEALTEFWCKHEN